MTNKQNIKRTAELAILTAIVIAFQFLGAFIHIGPTSISLVLIPIVIGAVLTGPKGGAFLGFVFGAMTYFAGVFGADGFTQVLFSAQPVATAVICFGKGICAGLCAGLIYRALAKKNVFAASIAAAAVAPIVNTGLFILGGLLLVNGTLSANLANFGAGGQTVVYFLIIGCAGLNFIAEFLVNLVVSPAINTIVRAVGNKLSK